MVAEWGGIYKKLGRVYSGVTRGRCTVDSAFSKKNYPYLVKSAQNGGVGETPEQFAANVQLNAQATSMRQSAEWGMRALQASFPRLKDRFIYEEFGERKIILKTFLLLYNLRARKVGINQIKSTYMPALAVNANETFLHN